MCGAKNRPSAEECHACGEPLSPGSAVGAFGVWRDGNKLVMNKAATLPYRCVKTNGEADLLLRRKLSWHHPLIFLSICAGLLVYVILALVLRKTADIRVPICHEIRQRRLIAIAAGWLVGLCGLGILFGGVALGENNPQWQAYVGLIFLATLIVSVTGIVICARIANIVTPARITEKYVWLKGVHPDYLEPLPDWPGLE